MIQLYWKNATGKVVGKDNGISTEDIQEIDPHIRRAYQNVTENPPGYAALPTNTEHREQVMQLVKRHRANTTDLLILGIGGSALGNTALQCALNPETYNLISPKGRKGPRLFVLDNVDPSVIGETLKLLNRRLGTTLVNVISKSGETAETAAEMMIVRELLRKKLGDRFPERIVATTSASGGTLHEIAETDGYATLPIPDDVGGRFSVLSAVGLFSAAMCGIDIEELLAGASAMKSRIEGSEWRDNPACTLAAIKFLMFARKGKCMHVVMPYSNRLYALADWYRQLWSESLGKARNRDGEDVFTGPTPIRALGATDQHSQIQLYREGPNDKLIVFLEVAKHPREVRIGDVFADKSGLTYLRKTRLSKLLNAQKQATEYALAVSQRPSVTIKFPEITPFSIGEFIYLYQFTTSLMGELLNVNAYDQPAVELGKEATFALMNREGYEEMKEQMRSHMRMDRRYLI
jgi:glucose-6-phosphate isomerase